MSTRHEAATVGAMTPQDRDISEIKIELRAMREKIDLIDRCLRGDLDDIKTPSLVHRVGVLEESQKEQTALTIDANAGSRAKMALIVSVVVSLIAAAASVAASFTH